MTKILASILVGASLLVAVPAQARDHRWGVDNNHRSPYHHVNRHHHRPVIVHRDKIVHRDNGVIYLLGGLILGAAIADAKEKEERFIIERTQPVQVCTDWKEVMTDDGRIYKERICRN